ncbi:hypothetical protein Tco_0300357 [Tanacetum coccineum]
MGQMAEDLQESPLGVLPSNTVTDPLVELNMITSMDGLTLDGSFTPHYNFLVYQEEKQEPKTITKVVEISSSKSTPLVPPPETPPLNQLVYEPSPSNNYDFSCFDQPPQYHIDQSPPQDLDFYSRFKLLQMEIYRRFEEMLRPLKPIPLVGIREPEGSDDYKEVPFDDEQILRQHNTAPVTPPALAYTPPPPVLATMKPLDTFLMGNKVISTIPERENDEFIKSSVDDLVPIPRESELTLDSTNLECSMPIDPPLPRTDVLGDAIVDINLPLGEHLDTLSMRDREVDFNPSRGIEELERLLADDPVPVPMVFDEPLGHSDSISRSFEFEDISSLDPLESTLFIDESTLIVTPLPDPKQICLREVERFDHFFSLTQSGGKTRVMETPSFGFHHMPSPRHAAYSPTEVMYCYYHPHLTSGDGLDHGPKMK